MLAICSCVLSCHSPLAKKTHVHQAKAGYVAQSILALRRPSDAHGSRSASRVDEEFPLQFVGFEPVGSSPEQHVNVHVACSDQQAVCIPGGQDGMAMGEAYAEGAMGDDLGEC